MINNNEKKLSRNTKKRIQRNIRISNDMKLLLNKIKTEKKNKNKKLDNIKQLEILIVAINYANNPDKLQNALKELNKIHVVNKNLHGSEQEILEDYTGKFELVGNLKVGDQIRQIRIRFRNITDYEAYINAIDPDYESEDSIFNGYIYEIDTPQFNLVNRSQYGNGCDFKHELIEYRGKDCYIPTKGYCFNERNNF